MEKSFDSKELLLHMKWADAVVWRAVLAVPSAEDDLKLRELLYHIHLVQRAFLYMWEGLNLNFPKLSDFQRLSEIAAWGYEYQNKLSDFVGKVEASSLDKKLAVPWAKRIEEKFGKEPRQPTILETMVQVVSHSAYHRGQVNMRLREAGGEPPLTDFIGWVWFGKPEADWKGIVNIVAENSY